MFYHGLRFTRREEDVFRLLVSGKNHSEIAQELCIAKHTAREYISRVYRKFDVHSRSELIAAALATGIVQLVFRGEVIKSDAL